MTRRATLRGAARTPFADERADVLICGASFAGLAVARELAGAGADVLVVDRYEIGERQTSACAAPTPWLHAMGVERSIRQELPCMAFHTPHGSANAKLLARSQVRQLCLECHSNAHEIGAPDTPNFHNQATLRYQNCTTCHVKIHGSHAERVFFHGAPPMI